MPSFLSPPLLYLSPTPCGAQPVSRVPPLCFPAPISQRRPSPLSVSRAPAPVIAPLRRCCRRSLFLRAPGVRLGRPPRALRAAGSRGARDGVSAGVGGRSGGGGGGRECATSDSVPSRLAVACRCAAAAARAACAAAGAPGGLRFARRRGLGRRAALDGLRALKGPRAARLRESEWDSVVRGRRCLRAVLRLGAL